MDVMKDIPDKWFELAIVDPPYGIGMSKGTPMGQNKGSTRQGFVPNRKYKTDKKWDRSIPSKEYFIELLRISKNQIITGGNYYAQLLPPSRCWIFWHKKVSKTQGVNFADGELIYTSFDKNSKYFLYGWLGLDQINQVGEYSKIHPTQKPIALYRWLLQNYAKPGDKIIDTHSGSGSFAIACFLEHHDFLAIEKDEDYYNSSVKRLNEVTAQGRLF
jgi:site-specific DNA-methyltransferase (adenine-specific)